MATVERRGRGVETFGPCSHPPAHLLVLFSPPVPYRCPSRCHRRRYASSISPRRQNLKLRKRTSDMPKMIHQQMRARTGKIRSIGLYFKENGERVEQ